MTDLDKKIDELFKNYNNYYTGDNEELNEEISNEYFINKEELKDYCPFCNRSHKLKKLTKKITLPKDGVLITFDEVYYQCDQIDDEENVFYTSELININHENAEKAYQESINKKQ